MNEVRKRQGRRMKILNQSWSKRRKTSTEICDFMVKELKKGRGERGKANGVWKGRGRFTTQKVSKSLQKCAWLLAASGN